MLRTIPRNGREKTMKTAIITTPCDTDFYKFSMKAAVLHFYPDTDVEYVFNCRTPNISLKPFIKDIKEQIELCAGLQYSPEELVFLSKVPYFKQSYIRHLQTQKWDINDVIITEGDSGIDIRVRGPWFHTIDWEIFLLAIISECWTKWQMNQLGITENQVEESGLIILKNKLDYLIKESPKLKFVDMGTRRRATKKWHEKVLRFILEYHPDCLAGTSNVNFSKQLGLKYFGTVAHEWDSAHLAFTHPVNAKKTAMLKWMEAFDGDAGTALTDTFTTDHFLTIFNKMFANAYTGVRHDSGPWDIWSKKILDHYKKLSINAKTKTLTFSDSLNVQKMVKIYNSLNEYTQVGFGIGTDITYDLGLGIKPLQIVIKMIKCNGIDVLKLSDDPAKKTCENEALYHYLKQIFSL